MTAEAYAHLLRTGPFPGRVDPWAEAARYFQQIHSGMIEALLNQIADRLLIMGYTAGKEASLQIKEIRKPDITVRRLSNQPVLEKRLDYGAAAAAAEVEPGIMLEPDTPDPEAMYIREMRTHRLVTVVEIISPRNKDHLDEMMQYKTERSRFYLANGINVVELDLTRSYHRLIEHNLTTSYPYHTAIFIPDEGVRVITHEFNQPLKSFALPLQNDILVVQPQPAYDETYYRAIVASQLDDENGYDLAYLPYPTLLTNEQRQDALVAVEAWQNELKTLKPGA